MSVEQSLSNLLSSSLVSISTYTLVENNTCTTLQQNIFSQANKLLTRVHAFSRKTETPEEFQLSFFYFHKFKLKTVPIKHYVTDEQYLLTASNINQKKKAEESAGHKQIVLNKNSGASLSAVADSASTWSEPSLYPTPTNPSNVHVNKTERVHSFSFQKMWSALLRNGVSAMDIQDGQAFRLGWYVQLFVLAASNPRQSGVLSLMRDIFLMPFLFLICQRNYAF